MSLAAPARLGARRAVEFKSITWRVTPLSNERAAVNLLCTGGDYEQLAVCSKDPVARQLSLLIRPTLIPDDGNVFVWATGADRGPCAAVAGRRRSRHLARLNVFRGVDADPTIPDLYTRTAAAVPGFSNT